MKTMRLPALLIYIAILFAVGSFAQKPHPTPTAEEAKEAQELAARFFNRYAETQDIKPLIEEYFISDFKTRWSRLMIAVEADLSGTPDDEFLRFYAVSTDFFFLYSLSEQHLKSAAPEASYDTNKKILSSLIRKYVTDSELLKDTALFEKLRENILTIEGYSRNEVQRWETINSALRTVDLELRNKASAKDPKLRFSFAPADFIIEKRIQADFFDFPDETVVFKASHDRLSVDLFAIKEKDKLLVAVVIASIIAD